MRSPLLDPGEAHGLVVDLRRFPPGTWDPVIGLELRFRGRQGRSDPPVLKRLESAGPSAGLWLSERWQRLTCPAAAQRPLLLVAGLAAATVLAGAAGAGLRRAGQTVVRISAARVLVGGLLAVWAVEIGFEATGRWRELGLVLARNQGLDWLAARRRDDPAWIGLLDATAALVPEEASVGVLAIPEAAHARRDFAAYWLYPRAIVDPGVSDWLIISDLDRVRAAELAGLDFSDCRLAAQTDSVHLLLTRQTPIDPPLPGRPLPARHWTLTASPLAPEAPRAADGDPASRWTTGRPMAPGDWLQIDLGRPAALVGLRIVQRESPNDFPRGYRVLVSLDGENWEEVVAGTLESLPGLILDLDLPGAPARFLRLEQTGSNLYYWSVPELLLTEAVPEDGR